MKSLINQELEKDKMIHLEISAHYWGLPSFHIYWKTVVCNTSTHVVLALWRLLVGSLGRIQSESRQFGIKGHTHRKALRPDLSRSACLPDASLRGESESGKTEANVAASSRSAETSTQGPAA